jgi:hypothetical protein
MADPTSGSPQTPRRRRRRRRERSERRRRLALLLLLLALATGAVVLAPGLIELIELGRPNPGALRQPPRVTRSDKPLPVRSWRFDFSMGPILELIEQSLRLESFDMRRPLRIPFSADWAPRGGGQILLSDPGVYRPSLVPGAGGPSASLPPPFQIAWLPDMPPITDPGSDIPNGQPDFDPNLADGDDPGKGPPFNPPGPPPTKPPVEPPAPPPNVPEPAVPGMLVGAALVAAALARSRARR